VRLPSALGPNLQSPQYFSFLSASPLVTPRLCTMSAFSRLSIDDLDDWAGLSGLSLGNPPSSAGTGLTVVPPSSSSQPSPVLTTTSSGSASGEYNAFIFVGGLVAGGEQNAVCGFSLRIPRALNPALVR
jgi:hypothetical protein